MNARFLPVVLLLSVCSASAAVTTPRQALGFNIGDDYEVANYSQLVAYWQKLASESPRMKLVEIGKTGEGRPQYMAILSSPSNLRNLAKYKSISQRLAHAEGLSESSARQLAHEGKTVMWIDGGLHANETVGSQQLMETVYQLVSRNDPETVRLLNDSIVLCVPANPDGQEMVANWYMREKDPLKRSLDNLPKLYNRYAGHDDNRDFYMSNLAETVNMNRQLFVEWFPQIVYDHHQTGPAGAVIFIPPFRDPFNYHFDPLIPLGVEMVGTAMHSRLVAEGKGGSAMRSGATYSTWWNGGLRTINYFHNMIGILTEIIGNPTPIDVALVPEKQLPSGDWPLPAAPGKWHYRQSIDYEITNNYAMLDLASKYREEFLFNMWRMGMNSIDKGSRDSWTVTPKRIEALKAAAPPARTPTPAPGAAAAGGQRAASVPAKLYETVLHDPAFRDPRGYIIPVEQPDFPTATKFVNTLLRNGIDVERATAPFTVNGKKYAAGSLVVKTAQAFRPHILDMFEPQDHPNDFRYPGGPPMPPYDITGWTLGLQMGVAFDRVLQGFDGPFAKVKGELTPPPSAVGGDPNPAGWLLSHRQNDAFVAVNRLLKAQCDVYWLAGEDPEMGTGAVWVPASSPKAAGIVADSARQLGITVKGLAVAPAGQALRLKPIRVGLYEPYGGLMPAGWTRFLLEQFEFPFQTVNAETVEAGSLRSKFDVLVLVTGAARTGARAAGEKAVPQIRKFLETGGSVVAVGNSTAIASLVGVQTGNQLADVGPDGKEKPFSQEKFYVPGSLLRVSVDNKQPLAYGMSATTDVFFENSPVFKLKADAAGPKVSSVAWFASTNVLDSGWAWGQQLLNGGTAIATASVGEGKLMLLGPEVAFRGQPHGTFKFLFNGLYYGSAQTVQLP